MYLAGDALLLRIFIGESDQLHSKPLYEQIVLKARELDIAGATVIRGILGFGASSRIHSAKLLDLSEDLPLVIEIIDTEDKIEKIMPFIEANMKDGLVTMEKVKVMKYGVKDHGGKI